MSDPDPIALYLEEAIEHVAARDPRPFRLVLPMDKVTRGPGSLLTCKVEIGPMVPLDVVRQASEVVVRMFDPDRPTETHYRTLKDRTAQAPKIRTIDTEGLHVHFTANTLGEKEIDDLTAIEDWYRQTEGTGKIGEVVFHGPDGAETSRPPITGVRVVSHAAEVDTAEDWARALADPGTGEDPAERVEPVGSPPTRPAARRSPRISRPAPERPPVERSLPSVALVGPGALVTLEAEVRRLAEAARAVEWVRDDVDGSEGYRATVEGVVSLDVFWDVGELTSGTSGAWIWEVDLEQLDLDDRLPICHGAAEIPGPEGLEVAKATAIEDVADALTLALWRVLGHPKNAARGEE